MHECQHELAHATTVYVQIAQNATSLHISPAFDILSFPSLLRPRHSALGSNADAYGASDADCMNYG